MALFPDLYRHDLPGAKAVFARLARHGFRTVVENLDGRSLKARGCIAIGGCRLGYHVGPMNVLLMIPTPEAASVRFWPLPGSRCLPARRPR